MERYVLKGRDPDSGQVVEIAELDTLERVVRLRAGFWPACDEFRDLTIHESDSSNEERP